jgi:hypothetical protein
MNKHKHSSLLLSIIIVLLATSVGYCAPRATNSFSSVNTLAKKKKKKKKKRRTQCNDKKDNDRDKLIDYPKDPGCRSRRDRSERKRNKKKPTISPTHPNTTGPTPIVPNPPELTPTNNNAVPNNTPVPPTSPLTTPPELGIGARLNDWHPFPFDNPWNTDISSAPVDPNSNALIASIGAEDTLHPDFGTVWNGKPIGIPYVIVGGNQPKHNVTFAYASESDVGPYPIPNNVPIEGGPDSDGDRHVIIIDRDNWKLYELFYFFQMGNTYRANSGAIFDLKSNHLRPPGWTSADAAGLPIFPGLVRYEEVMEKKVINHALRFTVRRTRRAYVPPARHYASTDPNPNLPPMGMRVRLKQTFDHTTFAEPVQVILIALKKYGMIVADNGNNWNVSGAPDSRWNDSVFQVLKTIKGKNFEVIRMDQIVTE